MTNKGDVTYEIRADDSKVEADLEQANKKVKRAAEKSADDTVKVEEQKTKDIKAESDKVVKNADKAADKVADAWKEAGQDAEKAMSSIDVKDQEIDVDADTSKAESKIKAVSKDESIDVDVKADVSDAKQGLDDLSDSADDLGQKLSDALGGGDGATAAGNIGNLLKSSFTDAASSAVLLVGQMGELTAGLSGASLAAVGAGAAVVGVGALAVGAANNVNSAMNSFIAMTGKGTEESERYQEVMENIYAGNYGENFEDIGQAMGTVVQQLGDMDDVDLQNVTESAFALQKTFGYDIQESTRAAKAMMDNFGTSGEEAMNLIATGAQNNLEYSGELLDSISEYSVQFGKMGLDAEDMFAIFEKGADSGAFSLDKVGDAVKEMSIRVVDGSDTTREGFELLGLDADEMAEKFAAGGETAKEAFDETLEALASMEDPIEQNTAGVDLMGTMWEDLGPEAVTALADIEEGAYNASDAMNQIKDVSDDDLGSKFEELKRSTELLLVPLGEALIPLLSTLAESVLPVVTDCLGPLLQIITDLLTPIINLVASGIQPLISAFMDFVNTAVLPLVNALSGVLMPVIEAIFNSFLTRASTTITSVTTVFRNLIDFVRNVFTGNWKAAWENVKEIFRTAVSGLANIFKAPLNAIVDAWNGLASSIGSITIPDWVPGVGGNSYSLPKMSRLKVGLDYVPNDMFPAYLDEGEWVLTKEEANLLRSYGGLEGMVSMLDRNSDGINVTVSGGSGQQIDYKKLGTCIVDSLVRSGVGFKCDDRIFARLIKDLIDYV